MEGRKPQGNGKTTIPPDARFYRVRDLCNMLQVSRETIARMSRDGRLTPPVYFGPRSPRWARAVIDRWIAQGCPLPTDAQKRIDQAIARPAATRRKNDQARQQKIKDILERVDRGEVPALPKQEEQPCPA